jgi:hypothetical protein
VKVEFGNRIVTIKNIGVYIFLSLNKYFQYKKLHTSSTITAGFADLSSSRMGPSTTARFFRGTRNLFFLTANPEGYEDQQLDLDEFVFNGSKRPDPKDTTVCKILSATPEERDEIRRKSNKTSIAT